MRIADLLEHQRPVFSFEFFPPKTDEGQETLRNTLEVLKDDEPDYVSVTYGAGGTTRNRTVDITKTSLSDVVKGAQFGDEGVPLGEALKQAVKVRVVEGFSTEAAANVIRLITSGARRRARPRPRDRRPPPRATARPPAP